MRERATSEKWPRRTRTTARCPRTNAPCIHSVAHISHAHAPHFAEVSVTVALQDGVAEVPQSDAMEVDSTMEARPHAPPPLRGPAPRPASLLGLFRTTGMPTLVLCLA